MKTKVLFVCLGNICRSPTAEGVMQKLVVDRGLADSIEIDSAGTGSWHVGERADARMRRHASKRGYDLTSTSRKVKPTDFEDFDYIITMDEENFRNVTNLDKNRKYSHKIHRMIDFLKSIEAAEVPDPYYGGDRGFELVIDILEDACSGLLEHINKETTKNAGGTEKAN